MYLNAMCTVVYNDDVIIFQIFYRVGETYSFQLPSYLSSIELFDPRTTARLEQLSNVRYQIQSAGNRSIIYSALFIIPNFSSI